MSHFQMPFMPYRNINRIMMIMHYRFAGHHFRIGTATPYPKMQPHIGVSCHCINSRYLWHKKWILAKKPSHFWEGFFVKQIKSSRAQRLWLVCAFRWLMFVFAFQKKEKSRQANLRGYCTLTLLAHNASTFCWNRWLFCLHPKLFLQVCSSPISSLCWDSDFTTIRSAWAFTQYF